MITALTWLWRLLRTLVLTAFYATPLVGFWLASSLAAYLNGPAWLAWTCGLAVFPVLPVLWELRAYRKWRARGNKPGDLRVFTLWQRLSLRTFTIGLFFLGALLYTFPRVAFVSLSARGDWMLDGVQGARADQARRVLFAAADGLEWLYRATSKNPYEALVENSVDRVKLLFPDPNATTPLWPWKNASLHPLVAQVPPAEETSLESVARWLARNETDPFLRVKALHDYVADRIAYDAPSLYAGKYPPQDAATVFKTRLGVCAGYANLLAAMGKAASEEIIVVVGDARSPDGKELTGGGHAWNAAKIQGQWYLIDVTWDSGTVSRETGFTKRYSAEYLLPPPRAMALDHIPRDAQWQLLSRPLTQGDFLRQPMLRPAFFAEGLELLSPQRGQNEAKGKASIMVKNPHQRWLMASLERAGKVVGESTVPTQNGTALIEVPLPGPGTYTVNLFSNDSRSGDFHGVGSLEFVVDR